jgi:hypothetical protein
MGKMEGMVARLAQTIARVMFSFNFFILILILQYFHNIFLTSTPEPARYSPP